MSRRVKGSLFVDYVRMLRFQKQIAWSRRLQPEDVAFLEGQIDLEGWYPMETFERFGVAILDEVAQNDLVAVRMWGRMSTDHQVAANPSLLVANDPCECLMRFLVLRLSFFDFEALSIPHLADNEATLDVHYGMGPRAEQAAAFQTLGFFTRLLELAGAQDVKAALTQRVWEGDAKTLISLEWRSAGQPIAQP